MTTAKPRVPFVYLITAGATEASDFERQSKKTLESIERAVEAGISFVQLREKRLPARLLFELARAAAALTRGTRTRLLGHDRADGALAAGADGVHLTSTSLAAGVIRAAFPPGFLIGVSAHTVAELRAARDDRADFAVFSPVFASPGKGAPQGLDALRAAAAAVAPFPVLALGGVDETNYRACLAAASGFAAIRFLHDAENLRRLSEELKSF